MTFWANFTHISMRNHKSSLFYVSTFQNNHPYLVDYGKFFIIFNILFPTVVWNYLSFILLFSIYFRIVYLMFDFGSNINFLRVFFVSFFFLVYFISIKHSQTKLLNAKWSLYMWFYIIFPGLLGTYWRHSHFIILNIYPNIFISQ